MRLIDMPRGTGKTTNLIKLAIEHHGVLIVPYKEIIYTRMVENFNWNMDTEELPFLLFSFKEALEVTNWDKYSKYIYIDEANSFIDYVLHNPNATAFGTYSSEDCSPGLFLLNGEK